MRHGQTEFNVHGIWQGQADSPLSPDGIRQANAAHSYLSRAGIIKKIDHIYCSNLNRTVQTAQIAIGPKGNKAICMGDLAEMSFGRLDGKQIVGDPENYALSFFPRVGGESPEGAQIRVCNALERIALNPDCRNIFIVGHGVVGQLFYQHWKETSRLDCDGAMDNCAVATYEYDTVHRTFTCTDVTQPSKGLRDANIAKARLND